MRDALFFIARGVEADGDGVVRDCELLNDAMAGMGTKDERMYVCVFLLRVSANLVEQDLPSCPQSLEPSSFQCHQEPIPGTVSQFA